MTDAGETLAAIQDKLTGEGPQEDAQDEPSGESLQEEKKEEPPSNAQIIHGKAEDVANEVIRAATPVALLQ